jgi:catecholate siderophore receptor
MNYGMPWIRPTPPIHHQPAAGRQPRVLPLDPKTYYGMASDRNHGQANYADLQPHAPLRRDTSSSPKLRKGAYERDQRASTVRFAAAASQPGGLAVKPGHLRPRHVLTAARS